MLYHVLPNAKPEWVNYFRQEFLDDVTARGVDLGSVQDFWEPADGLVVDSDVVRVILRRGTATSRGIAVPAIHIDEIRRPAQLRALFAESEQAQREYVAATVGLDDFIESQAPGWKAHGAEVARGVEEAMARSLAEADEEADEVFAAPVNDELVAHWKRLGGSVPADL